MEPLEGKVLRPRQVRYQAALRPDSSWILPHPLNRCGRYRQNVSQDIRLGQLQSQRPSALLAHDG
jgi:hypothetical protein